RGLAIAGNPVARLRQICDRIPHQLRIVERVDVALAYVRSERGDLTHHQHQIALHRRIVELPTAAPIDRVANAGERESSVVGNVRLDAHPLALRRRLGRSIPHDARHRHGGTKHEGDPETETARVDHLADQSVDSATVPQARRSSPRAGPGWVEGMSQMERLSTGVVSRCCRRSTRPTSGAGSYSVADCPALRCTISFQPERLGSVYSTYFPFARLKPPTVRSTPVVSVVTSFAPVRHGVSYGTRLSVFSCRPRRCGWP